MALITKDTAVQGYDSLGKFKRLLGKLITDSFTNYNETVNEAFELTKGHCFYCGQKLYIKLKNGDDKLIANSTIDHVIPSSEMGLLVPGNTVVACECCNKEKGNMSAKEYFNQRYNNQKVTLYDTPSEFDEVIDELTTRYSNDWPMMFLLNKQINEGALNQVSIESILKCASVNPSNTREVMLDFNYVKSVNEEPESLPENVNEFVNNVMQLSSKTNKKSIQKEKKYLAQLLLSIEENNKNIINDLESISRKEITNEIKTAGLTMDLNIERVLTLVGVYYGNTQITFNSNVAKAAKLIKSNLKR